MKPSSPSAFGPKSGPWGDGQVLGSALVAETSYCLVSAGTILFNKHALSTYRFPAPNLLLTIQFGIAVVLLKVLDFVGILHLEPLQWEVVKLWFPVNVIFVLMNTTGFYALMSVSAGMFTVLKNLSNLLTILGDWYFFEITYSWKVWACLGLMTLSAAMGGWTDLSFSPSGYAWQLLNCVFTASYSLHLSSVVRAAAAAGQGHGQGGHRGGSGHRHGRGGGRPASPDHHLGGGGGGRGAIMGSTPPAGRKRLNELSMVYYNNVLSVPLLVLLSLACGEPARLAGYALLGTPDFVVVVLMGALLGFGVSFASIWCMSRTSATIYSLTGSMNKVVVAVAGMWYFAEPATTGNLVSIGVGLAAGFLFVFAKSAPSPPHSEGGAGGGGGGGVGAAGGGGGPGSDEERLLGEEEDRLAAGGSAAGGVGFGPADKIQLVTMAGANQPAVTSRVVGGNAAGGIRGVSGRGSSGVALGGTL